MTLLYQIVFEYWQVLGFKRSPLATPNSPLMLGIGILLALLAAGMKYYFNGFIGTMHFSLGVFCLALVFEFVLMAMYIRAVLWMHQAQDNFLAFMTCWVMMMFFLDTIMIFTMGCSMGLQALGLIQYSSVSFMMIATIIGLVLSLWQIIYVVYLFKSFIKCPIWQGMVFYLGWLLINYLYILLLINIVGE